MGLERLDSPQIKLLSRSGHRERTLHNPLRPRKNSCRCNNPILAERLGVCFLQMVPNNMPRDDLDRAFVSGAKLYAIVPETSNPRFSEVLSGAQQDDETDETLPLPITERKVLFFGELASTSSQWYSLLLIRRYADEKVIVYVVLRIIDSSEKSLKQYLPRLQIKLDVWAVSDGERERSGGSKTEGSGHERDLVFADALKDSDDPLIVLSAEDEDDVDKEPVVLAIWQTEAILNRPRARFTSPALVFVASANLLPPKIASGDSIEDEYLPGFTPMQANVFESLKQIPALRNDPPYLPISRLDRVLPDAPTDGGIIKIRHGPARSIPIVQAVSARIRYSRLDASTNQASTIASLDFEVTRFIDLTVDLEAASVQLSHGSVDALIPQPLPISCRPRDVVTFMYRLLPAQSLEIPSLLPITIPAGDGPTADIISISTLATISVSDTCRAKISMVWSTNIDLSAPLNPNFGPPGQSLQRANRPHSLPVAAPSANNAATSSSSTPRTSVLWGNGLTISFSGPATPVELGKTFVWKVLIVNHGPKVAKLAIIPLPQIKRPGNQSQQLSKRHAPQISSSSAHQAEKRHTNGGLDVEISPAICDENIVYALQHQSSQGSGTDLLSLTPELRIGPLAPGACHEAEIRLLALKQGPLRVEAVRVVDLIKENEEGGTAAGSVTDIRDLPDVIAIKARPEDREGYDDSNIVSSIRNENDSRKPTL